MKNKIIQIILILLLILLILLIFIFRSSENTLSTNQTVSNIIFSDVTIRKKLTKYIFLVSLEVDKDVNAESFDANIKDEKGKSLCILSGYIGNMKSNETKEIEIETDCNLKNAYSVSYKVY